MKNFKEDLKNIYQSERSILVFMAINVILSFALMLFGMINLNPGSSVIKIGYGDIGGYRDGVWTELFAFVLLGLIFGVFHNLIAFKVFHKRGAGMTKFFLVITMVLTFGSFVVLGRLLGEG